MNRQPPLSEQRSGSSRKSRRRTVGVFSRASATYNTIGPRHFDYFAGRLLDLVAINHGDFVLDAATGTGAALFAAAHNVGATGHVLGIDLSAAMLLRASRAVQRASLSNVELKLGDAEHLELMTGTVDVVLCAFGISAFTNPEQALSEFRRVLRPGGRLGVVDTFGWYFQHDARWRRHAEVLKVFGANGPGGGDDASERRLQTMVAGAGFVEVVAVADSCPLVFEDEDQWWRWSWSHGTRGLLESVSPRRRPELKRQLCATLADCRDDGGRIQGQLVATIVLAVAPGP